MPSRTLEPEVQYATLDQQSETAQLGLWLFLTTETLFFGALLLGYTVLRHAYPEGFAEAGKETKIVIGTVNTAVLLTSSATMAWAVHAIETGNRRLLHSAAGDDRRSWSRVPGAQGIRIFSGI